ncbi:MAG: hypothetical protein ILO34_03995 [Kiritimatiellae bacterium]|nr:hypothetical protein [Kiritimatiellia bacterium]
MSNGKIVFAAAMALASAAFGAAQPELLGAGTRYATDAYPGFDSEDDMLKPSRKEPRWFSWLNGPAEDNAADQFALANELLAGESWRAARKAFDALVREWPVSPEAPKAQQALAELYLGHYLDYEDAFAEFRYLLDFYSSQCDYEAIAAEMYKTAEMMRDEGKKLLFFRFANTVDVRRAYESLVLRAPGAGFVPDAMLTIASLREDEGELEKAIQVYENLRNLHPASAQAKKALYREAKTRMTLLREREYNRARTRDTIDYLKLALAQNAVSGNERDEMAGWLSEAEAANEEDAFRSAKFYDSRTRTRRSAISAYERFLSEHPASARAPAVRARIAELQEESK